MAQKRYEVVISDLGNVLVSFDHRIAVRRILPYTQKKDSEVYQLFFDSPLTALFEEGKISPHDFFRSVKELLGLKVDYDTFLPIWNDIFFETSLNKRFQDFLLDIKPVYKLVMISNINKVHFEFLKSRMDIFRIFDKLILSYEVGYRKPDTRIYKLALESVDIETSSAFYIDDRKDLVEEALKLGIRGIVFDGEMAFETIIAELKTGSCSTL